MRLGRVEFCHGYVVDLDNEAMVQHAADAIYDDIFQHFRDGDIGEGIQIVKADPPPIAGLTEGDIPNFLTEMLEWEKELEREK